MSEDSKDIFPFSQFIQSQFQDEKRDPLEDKFIQEFEKIIRSNRFQINNIKTIKQFVDTIKSFCLFFQERYSEHDKDYQLFFKNYQFDGDINYTLYEWIESKYKINTNFVWYCLDLCLHSSIRYPLGVLSDFLITLQSIITNDFAPIQYLPLSELRSSDGKETIQLQNYKNQYDKNVLTIIKDLLGETIHTGIFSILSAKVYSYKEHLLTGPYDKYLEQLITQNELNFDDLDDNKENLVLVLYRKGYEDTVNITIISEKNELSKRIDKTETPYKLINAKFLFPFRYTFQLLNDSNIRELLFGLIGRRYQYGHHV